MKKIINHDLKFIDSEYSFGCLRNIAAVDFWGETYTTLGYLIPLIYCGHPQRGITPDQISYKFTDENNRELSDSRIIMLKHLKELHVEINDRC